MRWLKHLTNAADDEKLSEVLEIHGPEGYGIYWLIIEKIAAQMDGSNRTYAEYSVKKWAGFCWKTPKVFRKFLESFERLSLFSVKIRKKDPDFLIIDCPALASPVSNKIDRLRITNGWKNITKELHNKSGVYCFLTENNDFLYVGSSRNLSSRILDSANERLFNYKKKVQIIVYKTSASDSIILEAYLIAKENPLFNKYGKYKDDLSLQLKNNPEYFCKILFLEEF